MLRFIMMPVALSLLVSCQITDTRSQTTTREERLILGQTVIEDCIRSECGRLNLDSQLVEDYTPVAALTHVTAFMTSYSDFSDLSDIAAMAQLRELHIGQSQVTDLSGLSNFPNLTLLHAQGLNVDSYAAVGKLSKLEELALGRGNVGDVSFVRDLRNLRTLNLSQSNIQSMSGLRGHPSLENIDLIMADLPADISALLTIPNLAGVSIFEDRFSDEQKAVIEQLRDNGVEIVELIIEPVC